MDSTRQSKLFEPLTSGSMNLSNRIAMAPLTRYRAEDNHILMPMAEDYYEQRARALPGTLLISEAALNSQRAGGYANVPGIWAQDQIDAWKGVTEKVHRAGSYIFCQLISLGRGANVDVLEREGVVDYVSSSAIPVLENGPVPRALTKAKIQGYIQDFASAAKNAIETGCDGVEIDAANGFLIDQFTQDLCNKRTDRWGGSVENRSRFALEITDAVVDAIGADKTGIRLSPWSVFQGMRMKDPLSQFGPLIRDLRQFSLAYLHLVNSRILGDGEDCMSEGAADDVEALLDIWGKQSPVLLAGGYKPDSAKRAVHDEYGNSNVVIVFGRYFVSNPDLAWRIQHGVELRP